MTTPEPTAPLETTKLPKDQLENYFDRFTRRFLLRESTTAVDVEVLSPDLGDQFEAERAHLFGITYDPKGDALDFELQGGDHGIPKPKEVWVAEDRNGFVKAIEVVRDDGTREVARLARLSVAPSDLSPDDQKRAR